MFRESQKVFLACAVGAGIGSFVALEVSAMFCWVGFLLGGFVGYLFYEWKEVIKAVPKAYRVAAGYQFPARYFECCKWASFALLSFHFWIVALLFCLISSGPQNWRESLFAGVVSGVIFWMFCTFGFCGIILATWKEDEKQSIKDGVEKEIAREKENQISTIKYISLYLFPPLTFMYLLRDIVLITLFVAKRIPSFSVWFFNGCLLVAREWGSFWKKFLWNLFLRIHSEMRLLCGIDAFIGTVIGYFVGSALMGALAGGIVGVFNYAIVTELCLKRFGYIPIQK